MKSGATCQPMLPKASISTRGRPIWWATEAGLRGSMVGVSSSYSAVIASPPGTCAHWLTLCRSPVDCMRLEGAVSS